MGSVDYLSDIARTLEMFFQGLSDCGLLATYTVQFQNRVFDISFKKKFRVVINEFMMNLQKLLQNVCVVSEDEITFSVSTKDGSIPIIMKLADTDDDEAALNNSVAYFIDDITVDNLQTSEISIPVHETEPEESLIVFKPVEDEVASKPVENVLNMVCSKEKNDISEPWQLSILNNEEEDIAIDTITEVMTKNHLKDVGWQCDMCNKTFSRMQNLQDHCREEHNGTGCFECNICNTRVMTKLSLKRHIRSHSGIKSATCSICKKTFKRSDYLATHYKLHEGARTHRCTTCGKEFTSKTNLTLHERVHSDQKDYICQQCNKSFTRRDKLRDHMLRHLNIKRFQCSLCDKRYAEKRDLRTHLKVHEQQNKSGM